MSRAGWAEITLDGAGAVWLGLGSAFFIWSALPPGATKMLAPLLTLLLVTGITYRILRAFRARQFAIPYFELTPIDVGGAEELLLTEEMILARRASAIIDRYSPDSANEANELLLEDILIRPAADARVVQLFDASRMPTAGELRLRIDRHLRSGGRPVLPEPQPDASQALFDALADLRRSLG